MPGCHLRTRLSGTLQDAGKYEGRRLLSFHHSRFFHSHGNCLGLLGEDELLHLPGALEGDEGDAREADKWGDGAGGGGGARALGVRAAGGKVSLADSQEARDDDLSESLTLLALADLCRFLFFSFSS